jgi:hypothetical protein
VSAKPGSRDDPHQILRGRGALFPPELVNIWDPWLDGKMDFEGNVCPGRQGLFRGFVIFTATNPDIEDLKPFNVYERREKDERK